MQKLNITLTKNLQPHQVISAYPLTTASLSSSEDYVMYL